MSSNSSTENEPKQTLIEKTEKKNCCSNIVWITLCLTIMCGIMLVLCGVKMGWYQKGDSKPSTEAANTWDASKIPPKSILKAQSKIPPKFSGRFINKQNMYELAERANAYYSEPYRSKDKLYSVTQKFINGGIMKVYRPNYGLAQAMRRAFIVNDIIKVFINPNFKVKSPKAANLKDWLHKQLADDDSFIIRMTMVAAFWHAGRQSDKFETGKSANIIQKELKSTHFSHLCNSDDEINTYFKAKLYEKSSILKTGSDASFIRDIIRAADEFDSRRMGLKWDKIKPRVSKLLGFDVENKDVTLKRIWNKAVNYIKVTGDERISNPQNRNTYICKDEFYLQAKNRRSMIDTLLKAYRQSVMVF